jgi:hypothetical protein
MLHDGRAAFLTDSGLGVAAGTGRTAAASAVFAVRLRTRVAAATKILGHDARPPGTPGGHLALFRPWTARQKDAATAAHEEQRVTQVALLRDIFGPLPFRPVTVHSQILAWNDRLVPRLAQAIYDERRWGDMPLLGDALLDAGCDSEDMLSHAREQGSVHVRGCWLLDLLLNKE